MRMLAILLVLQKQVDKMNTLDIKKFAQQLHLAILNKKLYFTYKQSKDLETILKILQKTHFIGGYTKNHTENTVRIFLRYDIKGLCVIHEIKAISSFRQRIVMNLKQIKAFLNDYPYATALLRTRKGILNIRDCWSHRIGGEFLLCIK